MEQSNLLDIFCTVVTIEGRVSKEFVATTFGLAFVWLTWQAYNGKRVSTIVLASIAALSALVSILAC